MKMKKLFAIAALLLGSTSAFAAPVYSQDYTYQGLVYELYIDGSVYTATVKSIADDDTYKVKTTWEIPATFKALKANGANDDCKDQTFTVTSIGASAFANNSNITTIAFTKADNITSIGAAAFSKTNITSLDLSGTKIADLEELFEKVNTKVTEIKLPATLATIKPNAFEGLSVLTSIAFSNTETAIEINTEAFKNTMALTTLEFPNVQITLKDGSFDGSYFTTLTFNGKVIAKTGAFESDNLTAITFKGDVTAEEASFKSAKLATYNFNANLSAAGNIAAAAFSRVGTQTITVNYKPNDEGLVLGFAQTAFGIEGNDSKWATFKTTEAYGLKVTAATTADPAGLGWTTTGAKYGVKVDYTATTPDPTTITVTNKEGSSASYYYGTWYSTGKHIKIAKKQTDAGNVMVYGAYVDNPSDGSTAILMDQLMLIGGYYYIPKNTPVIVKASKKAPVVYTEDGNAAEDVGTANSTKKNGANAVNKIQPNGVDEVFAKDIITDAGANKKVYFLAPIAQYGFLWSEFNDNTIVAPGVAGGFWVVSTPVAAGGRLSVIWLDGSEEDQVTAIKAVKTAAEKGAIYNLAGQKVNASYKGVVIKDGKKYIQK